MTCKLSFNLFHLKSVAMTEAMTTMGKTTTTTMTATPITTMTTTTTTMKTAPATPTKILHWQYDDDDDDDDSNDDDDDNKDIANDNDDDRGFKHFKLFFSETNSIFNLGSDQIKKL